MSDEINNDGHCSNIYNIEIARSDNYGLGMGISGVRQYGDTGLKYIISDVIRGGPAYGKIKINDELLAVNGCYLKGMTYSDVICMLREGGTNVVLKIKSQPLFNFSQSVNELKNLSPNELSKNILTQQMKYNPYLPFMKCRSETALWSQNNKLSENLCEPLPSHLLEIHLKRRDTGESLGVELSSRLTILSVNQDGFGAKAGLRNGDRLITINGINTAHLSLVDTANILRRQETVLLIARESMNKYNVHNFDSQTTHLTKTLHGQSNLIDQVKHYNQNFNDKIINNNENLLERLPFSFNSSLQMENNQCLYQNCGISQDKCNACGQKINYMVTNTLNGNNHDVIYDKVKNDWRSADSSRINQIKSQPEQPNPKVNWLEKPNVINQNNQMTNKLFDSSVQPRKVILRSIPYGESGLTLVGGNVTGIFVSKVIPDSRADQAGIGEGDKLLKLNGTDLSNWTKEEVALALMADEKQIILELLYDYVSYQKVLESSEPCDSFYVRAYFDMNAYVSASPAILSSIKYSGLRVLRGDIFHVIDTLLDGALGSWLAIKICPNQSNCGIIPNMQRAERHMLTSQDQHNKLPILPYERVIQIESFPLPRPVVIFGPLAALARHRLLNLPYNLSDHHSCVSKWNDQLEEPINFVVPPINALPLTNNSESELNKTVSGSVRLSAIKEYMRRGNHCLLDITPAAIERLILLGIPPIVILINPNTQTQLKHVLQNYWHLNKNSPALLSPFKQKSRTKINTIKELVTNLWNSTLKLLQFNSHLITDTVPLINTNSNKDSFSELSWIKNLTDVIRHQQNCPVWLGEETEIARIMIEARQNQLEEEKIEHTITPRDGDKSGNQFKVNQVLDDNLLQYPSKPISSFIPIKHEKLENNLNENTFKSNRLSPSYENKNSLENNSNRINHNLNHSVNYLQNYDQSKVIDEQLNEVDVNSQNKNTNTISSTVPIFPNISIAALKLHIQSKLTRNMSNYENNEESENFYKRMKSLHETEFFESMDYVQTPTTSPTLSLHQLILEDPSPSEFVLPKEPKVNSFDNVSNFADPQSVISSIPASPRTILAETSGEFGPEGGILEIPEHKVCLRIPAGAISDYDGKQKIFLRVYDSAQEFRDTEQQQQQQKSRENDDQPTIKSKLVSPMVMCGPRGLRFLRPVELTVPRYQLDSDSSDESENINKKTHLQDWNLSLLHASAVSTSISTDEDSLPPTTRSTEPTKWHEIPLNFSNDDNDTNSSELNNRIRRKESESNRGIFSSVKDTQISILIDHF